MAQTTSSNEASTSSNEPNTSNNESSASDKIPSTTSENDRSDDPDVTYEILMRGRFESLLDESSSDDETSTVSDSSNNKEKNSRAQTNFKKRTQSSRSEDDADETILSLMWMKGHLGAAYYNVITSELFVMDDVMDDNSNHGIMKSLYRQCQPRYVVTTTGISDDFLDVVKKLIITEAKNQDDTSSMSSSCSAPIRVSLKLMPKKEHTFENCYYRVLCLRLNCEPEKASNAERTTFLNSLLNFKSRLMIHALGLLLKYVDANWNSLTLEPTGHAEFLHICYVMLQDLVMIDEETYKVLGIVHSRFHPSLFKFGNVACKDHGVSLFKLLQRCQSRPGIIYLWKLLRRPTRDKTILKRRFETIKFFLNPNNQNIVETLKTSLRQIHRLTSSILNRYSAPQAKISDWSKLQKSLSQVICIGDICAEHRNAASIFAKIADSITSGMHVVQYFIDWIVDFEASTIQGKLVVRPGVDPNLDKLISTRQRLPQLLSEMGERDMKKYSNDSLIERCRMIYLPDICYVLAITKGGPADDDDMPELEFKFAINGVRYYKSDGARELDDTIGDVMLQITNRQSLIILKLVRYMSKHMGSILKSIELCAELDTLLSLSMVARDHNYVMPELVDSKTIAIKQGRHPLKELLVNFVPNDTYSGNGSSLVKILTGPNACGKSVYLKQIALIVFMAHIGSFVPAESATIGIVSHILTQMNSVDSLAQNASSFLLGLRQINFAIYASTPNTLLIIDEFGAGTSEIDGLALLTAVLQSFVEREIYCPHIFAATHIHRVVELLPQTPMIEAQTFEYLSNETNDLVFLHRLISGKTTCSFAHSVAKSAGLDGEIVQRALEVFEAKKRGTLPTPLPSSEQEQTIRNIMELLCASDDKIDLEEVKTWVSHAIAQFR